jgi:hypothetical protein
MIVVKRGVSKRGAVVKEVSGSVAGGHERKGGGVGASSEEGRFGKGGHGQHSLRER